MNNIFSWETDPRHFPFQQNLIDLEDPEKFFSQKIFPGDKGANLKQILTCLTCTEGYNKESTQPIVLPCGHTFCSKCMIKFGKKCPSCRESFQNAQVKKNFIVLDLLEELSRHSNLKKEKEKCLSHKREIDRFCKTCNKLMCSVCHCEHIGCEDVISDENLRDEILNIRKFVIEAEAQKKDLRKKIKDFLQQKKDDIERKEAPYKQRLERTLESKIEKFSKERDNLVQRAEEIAKEKIKIIEAEKQKSILQAETMMQRQIELKKEEQKKYLEIFSARERRLFQEIEKNSLKIQQKIDVLEDFEDAETTTLEECASLYKLWELQRYEYNGVYQEMAALNERSIEFLLEKSADERVLMEDQRQREERLISDLVDDDLWNAWIYNTSKK